MAALSEQSLTDHSLKFLEEGSGSVELDLLSKTSSAIDTESRLELKVFERMPFVGAKEGLGFEKFAAEVDRVLATIEDPIQYISSQLGELPANINEQTARELIARDLGEKAISWYGLYRAAEVKQAMVELAKEIFTTELDKPDYDRISGIDKITVSAVLEDLEELSGDFSSLIKETNFLSADSKENDDNLRHTKTAYVRLASMLAADVTSLERVSSITNVHGGPVRVFWGEVRHLLNDRTSVYTREFRGSWGELLVSNIAREYSLPDNTGSSSRSMEVFTSGMGGLNSIMGGFKALGNVEMQVTDGVYFEVAALAQIDKSIIEPITVGEEFYTNFKKDVEKNTVTPLVLFSQPYSSSPEDTVFDLDRTLAILNESEFKRPVYIVVDSTMHGANISESWKSIGALNEEDKKVTLIHAQSLMKNSQIGTDKASGGLALAYGSNPEIINISGGSFGALVPEVNAAYLFPVDSSIQMQRIHRAGRNAEFLSESLKEPVSNCPLFEKVFFATDGDTNPKDAAAQYGTKPPFLFVKMHPLIASTLTERINLEYRMNSKGFPVIGRGTSYGFDETRVEVIPIGPDNYLRIAAGQESSLHMVQTLNKLESLTMSENVINGVRRNIRDSIRSITEHMQTDINEVKGYMYFDPTEGERPVDLYMSGLSSGSLLGYLGDGFRGWELVDTLKNNANLKEYLQISDGDLEKLEKSLLSKEKIEQTYKEWAITQPTFITNLQNKLQLFGNALPREHVHLIAKYIIKLSSIKLDQFPVAKDVFKTLEEFRPKDFHF